MLTLSHTKQMGAYMTVSLCVFRVWMCVCRVERPEVVA